MMSSVPGRCRDICGSRRLLRRYLRKFMKLMKLCEQVPNYGEGS